MVELGLRLIIHAIVENAVLESHFLSWVVGFRRMLDPDQYPSKVEILAFSRQRVTGERLIAEEKRGLLQSYWEHGSTNRTRL